MDADKSQKGTVLVKISPEEQDECGYLYHSIGMQYLAASTELTKNFMTEEEVFKKIEQIAAFYEVIAQNFSLSIECFLKTYLKANEHSEKELSDFKIRHNLLGLLELAEADGLSVSEVCHHAIEALSAYYANHRFRYVKLQFAEVTIHSPVKLRLASEELYRLSHRAMLDRAKQLKIPLDI